MADEKKKAPEKGQKPDVPGVDVPDPDGDQETLDPKYAEPKGTKHSDQFNTQFPGEKTVRK